MFGTGETGRRLAELEDRVRAQDLVIRELCRLAGLDYAAMDPVGTLDEAELTMVREGKPIQAMKTHRQRTGASLVQAKRAVDRASGTGSA